MAFTPHSFRAFLPSVHSALGYDKSDLAWLSAWSPSQAATYVRAGKATSLRMQQRIGEALRRPAESRDEVGEADFLDGGAESLKRRELQAVGIGRERDVSYDILL